MVCGRVIGPPTCDCSERPCPGELISERPCCDARCVSPYVPLQHHRRTPRATRTPNETFFMILRVIYLCMAAIREAHSRDPLAPPCTPPGRVFATYTPWIARHTCYCLFSALPFFSGANVLRGSVLVIFQDPPRDRGSSVRHHESKRTAPSLTLII